MSAARDLRIASCFFLFICLQFINDSANNNNNDSSSNGDSATATTPQHTDHYNGLRMNFSITLLTLSCLCALLASGTTTTTARRLVAQLCLPLLGASIAFTYIFYHYFTSLSVYNCFAVVLALTLACYQLMFIPVDDNANNVNSGNSSGSDGSSANSSNGDSKQRQQLNTQRKNI